MVSTGNRLHGLDIARFVAFTGMVIVNFNVVMGADAANTMAAVLSAFIAGKAAATFVVLSGIGLGLASKGKLRESFLSTFKKAIFLLVLGLLNMLVFEADILHYYAFYFVLGALLLPLSTRQLIVVIIALNAVSVILILLLNYDLGWNWQNYSYDGFWTPRGFVRNLFFNGWHPVIPWIGFLLFGFVLSRQTLSKRQTQNRLITFGALALVAAELLARMLSGVTAHIDPELPLLVTTSPVPPMPLFTMTGIGTASAVVGLCLRFSGMIASSTGGSRVRSLARIPAQAGRQTLTLYIAHIIIGMGTLEALGMLGNQTAETALVIAIVFCALALLYARVWSQFFSHGPIEMILRRLA